MITSSFRITCLSLICLILVGCGDANQIICDEGHPKVALAKQLTQDQLKDIFSHMRNLKKKKNHFPYERGSKDLPIPKEFAYLNPIRIHSEQVIPTVVLQKCVDHNVMLIFYGIDGDEEEKIVLQWGEGATLGRKQLWSGAK